MRLKFPNFVEKKVLGVTEKALSGVLHELDSIF